MKAAQNTRKAYDPVPAGSGSVPAGLLLAGRLGILILLLGGWEAGARSGLINPFLWSHPTEIAAAGLLFFGQGTALRDIWFTFASTILGFLLGTAGGAALGLSFWWSRLYAKIVEPYVVAFNAMPKLALGPLVILVFGLGLSSKVAMGVALTIVVTALTTYAGVQAVDPDLVRMLRSLGATAGQVFYKVVVPSVFPWIISSLRVNIGLALTGAVVGEFIGSRYGLGRLILYAGQTYEIDQIWVGVIILSVLSMVMYWGVGRLEALLRRGAHGQPGGGAAAAAG